MRPPFLLLLAPLAAADIGVLLERSGSAQLAELGRVGGTGEALLDAGVVAALLASGFPRRIFADGGAIAVRLVESGVGATLALESADTLKVLIEKRMIDRVLDLDLMDALLDRPDLTKAMFRSGVVKGVLSNGVLAALLRSGKERVCVSLLRGPMIETLMNTGLLPEMMTFEEAPGGATPPSTSCFDGQARTFSSIHTLASICTLAPRQRKCQAGPPGMRSSAPLPSPAGVTSISGERWKRTAKPVSSACFLPSGSSMSSPCNSSPSALSAMRRRCMKP